MNSVTHSELFGQAEHSHDRHQVRRLKPSRITITQISVGAKGATIAKDLELSVNVPVYLENQHYLTEKLSLLTGVQAIYVLRHFYDYFNDTADGDQSARE